MRTVLRYLRLYLYFMRFSFSKALQFRIDFWSRTLMDVFYYAMGISFFKLLYLHTASLGGWREDQALVFIAGFFVIDALQMTIIASNTFWLMSYITDGSLDYYLVRPVSAFFMVFFRDFAAGSFVNLLMACGILGWALLNAAQPFGILEVASYVALILLGFALYALLRFLLILPVFWLESGRGIDQMFYTIITLAERPDTIFRGAARILFVTVLPVCLMASFPVRYLFGVGRLEVVLHMLGVTAVLALLLWLLWPRALRAYGSASS